MILVCGPGPMMNSVSGGKAPKGKQGELSGALKAAGHYRRGRVQVLTGYMACSISGWDGVVGVITAYSWLYDPTHTPEKATPHPHVSDLLFSTQFSPCPFLFPQELLLTTENIRIQATRRQYTATVQ